MEKALFNGKLYTAKEVASSYELEKMIRKASGKKQLECPDDDCPNPIVRYCHGEKKVAYFAHLNNSNCDYAEFDKSNTLVMRQIKHRLFDILTSQGYNVQMEVKILPKHYTHLLVSYNEGKVAIELGTQKTSANQIEYLTQKYKEIGVDLKWIVINESQKIVKENETFFIKRYLLNENNNKDVLILNCLGTEISQYIVDPNKYLGINISGLGYSDFFTETKTIDYLSLENGELTIQGFYGRYQNWLNEKKIAFEKKLKERQEIEEKKLKERQKIEEKIRQREKQNNSQIKLFENKKNKFDSLILNSNRIKEFSRNESPNERTQNVVDSHPIQSYQDVLLHIDQQEEQVRDMNDVRWVRCKICKCVKPAKDFQRINIDGCINLGECIECAYKRKL